MLRRAPARVTAALAGAVLTAVCGPAAVAAGPPGGGFGGVVCGQSFTPGCDVTAAAPGSAAGGGPGAGGLTGGGGPRCIFTARTVSCPLAAGAPGGTAVAPAALARRAVGILRLPGAVIRSSPAPGTLQLTRLPTWLWVDPAAWHPQSATARVPGESVTATATPVSSAWQMGDGSTVTCHGPGTPYATTDDPASPSPTCGYTYIRSSAGQPDEAYQVTLTITWDITWAGPGGAGGALPPLFTAAAAAMRVAESQAVNTAGGA